jgi:Tfp pilus assembly protein PilF
MIPDEQKPHPTPPGTDEPCPRCDELPDAEAVEADVGADKERRHRGAIEHAMQLLEAGDPAAAHEILRSVLEPDPKPA